MTENNAETNDAFSRTLQVLQDDTRLSDSDLFLSESVPSLVSLNDVTHRSTPTTVESSLLTPRRGQMLFYRALEELEQRQPQALMNAAMVQDQQLVQLLTEIVTGVKQTSLEEARKYLNDLGKSIPRRVCQHPFRRNDIVWVCRTCQADETCVLCHACYDLSNHDGHDVAFYHAQAGGCCDCGDPDAWDAAGFCPHHGPSKEETEALPEDIVSHVQGLVPAACQWLVQTIAPSAVRGHKRTDKLSTTTQTSTNTSAETVMASAAAADEGLSDASDQDEGDGGEDGDVVMQEAPRAEEEETTAGSDPGLDLVDMGHLFVAAAASTSKSRHGAAASAASSTPSETLALQLGILAREEHGLYLVLHADDIHTTDQIREGIRDLFGGSAFYTDAVLTRLVKSLKSYGQLVVWGTSELISECSPNQVFCWKDGDEVATARIGGIILNRAARLVQSHGLLCSIVSRNELQLQQRAVAVMEWLTEVARSCDPLCQTVAASILPEEHLVPLLTVDFQLGASIQKAWHSLLLTLLAVPTFKRHLAAAYCDTYRHVTQHYARGMGLNDRSGYTLSVQFLNRVTYVVDLVANRNLLGHLGKALLETLSVAAVPAEPPPRRVLDPNHFVLQHRRYSPCISDLKCVLNVKGMARLFASRSGTFMKDWIQSLGLAQCMDGQVWRTWSQGHIEVEPRGWVGAFNASISLGSLFERLLSWDDDDPSPIPPNESILAQELLSSVDLTFDVLTEGLAPWQSREMTFFVPSRGVPPERRCSASLPYSTVAVQQGTPLAFQALPVAQVTPWSFHLPLHRFLTVCLREVCRRPDEKGVNDLLERLNTQLSPNVREELFRGLMEFPLLVLTRAAQVRAGLWKRNGSGMKDQVLNYGEPPFCRALRDADMLLVQFAMLGRRSPRNEEIGCSVMVHLLVHRLGLFDFLRFTNAPTSNINLYEEEADAGYYPREESASDDEIAEERVPLSYSPATDAAACLGLLEEFLHMLIVLASELPPLPPKDKADHTKQAKERLKREVVHRLVSGPKTHSELSEVHHVLSHWDNTFLSEEGKLANPDDASGAALGQALAEVAELEAGRDRLSPEKWVLRRAAWEDYDPAFHHISVSSHQQAAEHRPWPSTVSKAAGAEIEPISFIPSKKTNTHPSFQRLRRDITSDVAVLTIIYRTLHVHCRKRKNGDDDVFDQLNKTDEGIVFNSNSTSETILARAIHLLTIGAFAWQEAQADDPLWRKQGGGSTGSVFSKHGTDSNGPTVKDWIQCVFLADPSELMGSQYGGEENVLLLLQSLKTGESAFVASDRAVKAGAAWLCEFAARYSQEAAAVIGENSTTVQTTEAAATEKSDMERRKKDARARAMEKMKAEAARFTAMMQLEADDEDENAEKEKPQPMEESSGSETTPRRRRSQLSRSSTFESEKSASTGSSRSPQRGDLGIPEFFAMYSSGGEATMDDGETCEIPDRLFRERPQCIICVEDGPAPTETDTHDRSHDEEGRRKRTRRKADRSNALTFVGYAQTSTVLKGGGGPPPAFEDISPTSAARRFTGTHVALCGHAVHSECWESYLATILQREDRLPGRREEFRCPLCQRLTNCLVPFIDVGVDWVDVPLCVPIDERSESDNQAAMLLDEKSQISASTLPHSLHDFLSGTPWWVGRNDKTVVWNGQCAFISACGPDEAEMSVSQSPGNTVDSSSTKVRRRRVRSLRKRDLYTAWNAMMRTPRFIRRRRKLKLKATTNDESSASTPVAMNSSSVVPDESSSGETVVWRRLMDLLSDMAFKADSKRLGDHSFFHNCGEFRHYHVERTAYNLANRSTGRESIDWPACISADPLPDLKRQELAREKLLSKLLMSIQSFTYTCSCEAFEVKRLLRGLLTGREGSAGCTIEDRDVKSLLSTYGIRGLACDGKIIIMPKPLPGDSEGSQPFNGRLGRLRYFGLSVIAAAGAVSADLVQLVMDLPLEVDGAKTSEPQASSTVADQPLRAPVVFPILLGHVLTHVVAAMGSACGWARARSDSLELAWPVPFSTRGSFYGSMSQDSGASGVDLVVSDCEGFIKLGFLARLLQVLLRKLEIEPGWSSSKHATCAHELSALASSDQLTCMDASGSWNRSCLVLLQKALSPEYMSLQQGSIESAEVDTALLDKFLAACETAAELASSFLADVGILFQILVPGVAAKYDIENASGNDPTSTTTLSRLASLQKFLGIEPVDVMLGSSIVHDIVCHWLGSARSYSQDADPNKSNDLVSSLVRKRLYYCEGFRCYDWPMASISEIEGDLDKKVPSFASRVGGHSGDEQSVDPMHVDTEQRPRPKSVGSLVAFSSKKRVPLIGGYAKEADLSARSPRPRISMLPTSYTDLYAELGQVFPDSDQTAICLVCGEILNSGGKGECSKHAYRCGAGSCIFFLLQECLGLLCHSGYFVYAHSPYVDSHGETPQYRGRPLNLDMDRYDALKELWCGHANRQKVIAERGTLRQQIIHDYY